MNTLLGKKRGIEVCLVFYRYAGAVAITLT